MQSHTRIIELLVSLWFRRSQKFVLQSDANVGTGTLAIAATPAGIIAGPLLATESLRGALLWLFGFSGAFVFIEPSPYEIVGLITIFLFAVTGLSLRSALVPLLLFLLLLNVGYTGSVVQVSDQSKPVIWVMVSAFLAVTALFYAAMLGTNTQHRLELLMRGYLAAAMVA